MQAPCWKPHDPIGPLQTKGARATHSRVRQIFASASLEETIDPVPNVSKPTKT
jgi:hypothetical protein